jgi:D-arabinose 1-dehydrogenase-like Zn-dependent alcohol dehydrogenase
MATMRAVQISRPNGPLELVERPIPEPRPGTVRIKVQACGICHSDVLVKENLWPGLQYPRVPGHEAVGVIDAVGPGVVGWKAGERVGVGWHGGYCTTCNPCRHRDFFACETGQVTGISFDGGYADFMIAPVTALARVPDRLSPAEAGPLMCAGVTTFNALRHCGASAGDLVAIFGLGGLGHLGVQYAAKMGFRTAAIARGADKEPLARKLGAHIYIDNAKQDAAAELTKLGGARAVLATVPDGDAMGALIDGLGVDGRMMVIGAGGAVKAAPVQLINGRRAIQGWYSGVSMDSQETMAFSVLAGVRSMNEEFPLARAAEAYERMHSGKARFRVVLTMS